ncbi:hypothetical protein BH20VER3_BH20VER3_19430 [soil metagenome]
MKIWPFAFVFALFTCGIIRETSAAPLKLITASEAAQPNLSLPKGGKPGGLAGVHSKKREPGAPQIIVEKPEQGAAVSTPFPVRVRFIPSSGAKINLRSFEIYVLKLIKISLLSRVKPYLTEKGINVPEAKVPSGTYNVQIAVADDQGRTGSTIQTWVVR